MSGFSELYVRVNAKGTPTPGSDTSVVASTKPPVAVLTGSLAVPVVFAPCTGTEGPLVVSPMGSPAGPSKRNGENSNGSMSKLSAAQGSSGTHGSGP